MDRLMESEMGTGEGKREREKEKEGYRRKRRLHDTVKLHTRPIGQTPVVPFLQSRQIEHQNWLQWMH